MTKASLSRSPMKSKLTNKEWEVLLRKLSAGELPHTEIGSAIAHLSKPLDRQRVAAAKDTVLRYLNHENSWARHEAMWFIRWAGLREQKSALIDALRNDQDPDNRGYAAMCIAHLLNGTSDAESLNALKAAVLNENEDESVRKHAYGALIEITTNQSGSDFYYGEKTLQDLDWKWLSGLA